eukprot:13780-Heterococcus_DN1.PRE.1
MLRSQLPSALPCNRLCSSQKRCNSESLRHCIHERLLTCDNGTEFKLSHCCVCRQLETSNASAHTDLYEWAAQPSSSPGMALRSAMALPFRLIRTTRDSRAWDLDLQCSIPTDMWEACQRNYNMHIPLWFSMALYTRSSIFCTRSSISIFYARSSIFTLSSLYLLS